jgi:peptide-methionine (S)-S-oxide reductase
VEVKTEIATLAGGCFWGVEDLVRKLPGVIDTEVGYCGGSEENPGYNRVKTGITGHAEALQIKYDPKQTNFSIILDFFFRIHNPTTKNQQGNDIGSQYRSAIFFHNNEQKQTALEVIEKFNQLGVWKAAIVTEVVPFTRFYAAEDYHQDYLEKNPNGYTCHYIRKF